VSPLSAERLHGGRSVVDVAQVARNLPFVLRTVLGIAVLGIGANVAGAVVVSLIVVELNASASRHQVTVLLTAAGAATLACVIIGVTASVIVQRRTLHWVLRGERPSVEDAHRALRMPRDLAIISVTLWTAGAFVMGIVASSVGVDAQTVSGIVGGIVLAGFSAGGVEYLLMGRINQPVARLALEACPPHGPPVFGVRLRLVFNWLLTSALPLVGLVFVLTAPHGESNIIGVGITVTCLALLVGALSTALIARAIGQPLRGMVDALDAVAHGDLDGSVEVEDAGEIGLVQNGFNEMVAGLRERDRITDLFGRHVGSSVAEEAMRSGVTLSGELRDVVAVFVDITGSTERSRRTDPAEFVAMLNRFFDVVVDEVEGSGGLLNKFEGDAALCVFGAPVELIDPASSALRAARRIRDRVASMGEVEIGIGVAAGEVVAGQVGTHSRLEYTVIGDPVNEAARLTDLAKERKQHVLASQAVLDRASPTESACWEPAGEVVLRGRNVPTRLWTA
jgi:adenylate cyclase